MGCGLLITVLDNRQSQEVLVRMLRISPTPATRSQAVSLISQTRSVKPGSAIGRSQLSNASHLVRPLHCQYLKPVPGQEVRPDGSFRAIRATLALSPVRVHCAL